jgi:hypothetical protein
MLYRAIALVLDFIHRLVRGRQKIPQRLGDLRTETEPVSETLWDFLSSTYKTMDKVQNKPNSSVFIYVFIWIVPAQPKVLDVG